MGVVLKAIDGKLQRPVAVKIMSVKLAGDTESRQRFVREARAAAAVSHDNIVTIHDVEEVGPLPYLVLEFVAGQSLDTLLEKHGPMPVTEIIWIGTQIAQGLEAAHKQGLVHRDIKPSNILMEEGTGRIKITDFGLARPCDAVAVTQSGIILGSPMYMSPEQAEGKAVDQRSDLFSLGSVLYALCTGQEAFQANATVAVLRRVCDVQPQSIRELNSAIPARLEAIIAKLLAKNVTERYQTAGEVLEALRNDSPAKPEKQALTFGRWLSLAALALVLLAGGRRLRWLARDKRPD
jgi:serine/threonine protein kinase